MHELECRRLQAGTFSEFVEYLRLATAALLLPLHVGIMDPRALLKILEPPVEDGAPERLSVRTLITRWRHQCEVDILLVDCLVMTPLLVGPILSSKASMCHVVGWVNVCAGRGCSSTWHHVHRPRIVIDWLAATEHVKNINQAWFTALAFVRILAKRGQCDVSEVMGSTRCVYFETLRRA